MCTYHLQECLMCLLYPLVCYKQHHISAFDIDRSVKDTPCSITSDWHSSLFSNATVTTLKRRRLSNDSFVKHRDNGALLSKKTAF